MALAVVQSVQAATCEMKEYAQYKDSARTPLGRQFLALEYCTTSNIQKMPGLTSRDRQACIDKNGKIMDSVMATKDTAMVNWALDGCPQGKEPKGPPRK
jgi:hypothetical protein